MSVADFANGLSALIPALQTRNLSAEKLVRRCIERIEEREPAIGAWSYFDPDKVLEEARAIDRGPVRGILHGIPIGIKDIIEVRDMPYGCGSSIFEGRVGKKDASCVALLRSAGAVVVGKTVTTEFGYFRPGKTKNPFNFTRTPGGSSSGSAAAVADAMVPIAFGAQTAGSVTRPAAYCGIVGTKLTHGAVDLGGVQKLAPSLDSLGWFSRSVEDAEVIRAVLAGERYEALPDVGPPRIGICETREWDRASDEVQQALHITAHQLQYHGARIEQVVLPVEFDGLLERHADVMAYEAARNFGLLIDKHANEVSAQFRDLVVKGQGVSEAQYAEALQSAERASRALEQLLDRFDAVLAPSAPGEAPLGLDATGDPVFSRVWSLLGNPSVALPVGFGPTKMPLGLQLIGRRGRDRALFAVAEWSAPRVGPA